MAKSKRKKHRRKSVRRRKRPAPPTTLPPSEPGAKATTDPVAQKSRQAVRDYFADLLTKLRRKADMSQAQAAERLGVNQTTVARTELGDRAVTIEELVDFYWAYHVSLQTLPTRIWEMHQKVYAARREAGAQEEKE